MSLARNLIVAAVAAVSFSSLSPFALGVATVYSDNFETDTSANYLVTVTKTATTANNGLPTSDAVFAYDYSQVGIPSAPHSTGGTTIGVRTRADELNGGTTADGSAVGAVSLVTKTISTLSNNYVVSVDVWGNYIGGSTGTIASDGPNTTTLALLGVGASGTSEESVNGSGGEIYGTTQDGGSTTDYRAYLKGVRAVATSGTYAAGNDAQSENNSNAYYTSTFPTHQAPTIQQTTYSATQTGSTPTGIIGFAWHTYMITNDGTTQKFFIDGLLIASYLDSVIGTNAGNNVSIGTSDTGLTGDATTAGAALNFDIFDNLTVVDNNAVAPEPTTLAAFAGLGGLAIARRRKAR